MAKTTHKLYVNLSASQTRKRLKGYGFGVRKVETAGRNQAVVHHTATGKHLDDLQGLFADALPSPTREELDVPTENLRNLGPSSAAWLREVGVFTRSELVRVGAVVAFQLVKQKQPQTSLNLLWAMEAGLQDRDWRDLTEAEKQKLLDEIED